MKKVGRIEEINTIPPGNIMDNNKHGGKRLGAGRKVALNKKIKWSGYISPASYSFLQHNDFEESQGELIDMALSNTYYIFHKTNPI